MPKIDNLPLMDETVATNDLLALHDVSRPAGQRSRRLTILRLLDDVIRGLAHTFTRGQTIVPTQNNEVALDLRAPASPTVNTFVVRTNGGAVRFAVDNSGLKPFLGNAQPMVLNQSSNSTPSSSNNTVRVSFSWPTNTQAQGALLMILMNFRTTNATQRTLSFLNIMARYNNTAHYTHTNIMGTQNVVEVTNSSNNLVLDISPFSSPTTANERLITVLCLSPTSNNSTLTADII